MMTTPSSTKETESKERPMVIVMDAVVNVMMADAMVMVMANTVVVVMVNSVAGPGTGPTATASTSPSPWHLSRIFLHMIKTGLKFAFWIEIIR